MTAICFEGTTTNPHILAMSERVFRATRLSVERAAQKVAGRPLTLPTRGIEQSACAFLERYRPLNRVGVDRVAGLSRSGAVSPVPTLRLPSLPTVNLDFDLPESVLEQAKAGGAFDKATMPQLTEIRWDKQSQKLIRPADPTLYARKLVEVAAFKKVVSGSSGSGQRAPAKAKELRLKLKSLKALRRFGWEPTDWGNDVIDCGGDGLGAGGDPIGGVSPSYQHVKASKFRIHDFKRDGEMFDIQPDRTFVKFDLNKPPADAWPRGFIANVFLSESDASGDFVEFLQRLWEEIGDEVVKIATALAMAAVGAGAGAAIGTELVPLVGTIVGAIVGAVIGLIVGWLVDSFEDDIFESPENPIGVTLGAQDTLFEGGSKTSPVQTQEFSLKHACYLMSYYWELVY